MKKTAVRVQEFKSEVDNIGLATLQILVPVPNSNERVEPIGHIQFQRNLSEGEKARWYGLTYKVDTSNIRDLRQMNKVADKVVAKCRELMVSSFDIQPVDVLDALNAERYGVFRHEFYPLSYEGHLLCDVTRNGEVYTRIAAPNQDEAQKKFKKLKLGDDYTLELAKYVISFQL